MRPTDLDLLSTAGRPALSPDGALAVVSVVRPDLAADAYTGGLWVVPTDGSDVRRLTGGFRDTAPAISPDGRHVAFLRGSEDGPAQLGLVGLAGGEPITLTDHPIGAGAPSWSPDGRTLVYTARVPDPGRYGTEDADGRTPEPAAEAPRLITQPAYRQDNLGFTRDRRSHVFTLDVSALAGPAVPGEPTPALPLTPRQLTTGDVDDQHPVWSPDGSRLAFVSARHESRETDLRSGIHVVPAAGGEVTAVVEGDLGVGAVQWLPDGRLVFTAGELGSTGTDFVGRPTRLWVTSSPVGDQVGDQIGDQIGDQVGERSSGGPAEVRALTGPERDLDASDGADFVLQDGRVIVREQSRGAVRLLAVDLTDGSAEVLLDGQLVATGHAGDGSTLVATVSTPDRAGDLALVRSGEPEWLTDLSARLRDRGLRPVRDLVAPTDDGHEVHGWLVLPDPQVYGDGPYPVLLNIHGGPYAQYDWGLFDEYQVYAGAGYAVLQGNPRGSAGYGPEHSRSIRHAMGTVDAADVLTLLDHALGDPALDQTRVGVMGGSYGGYMTALLTTRTDRFAAAVVERGYLDGTTFVGSSDIGWFFPGEYHGSVQNMREQSPMAAVDQVRTPTLVIHSEQDWRCPVEQGQRWFTALRQNGVPTELLLFPGEGHELSRSGRPRHRQQRFEHILRWWQQNLPVESTKQPVEQRAVEVRIKGSVQGVSFRGYAAREAVRLELTGWVRNEDDGSVLGRFEGPADAVGEMVDWCHQGSPSAHVRQVEVSEIEPSGATDFTIDY